MAQLVGYFEDNVKYTEGPFVVVSAGGYRIEVELKEHHCPVLPDLSVYALLQRNGFNPHKENRIEEAEKKVDWLNQQVREGKIVLQGRMWVVPGLVTWVE